jgi:hypothetical protein
MEQRLRVAIESIPSGFVLWDSDERLVRDERWVPAQVRSTKTV